MADSPTGIFCDWYESVAPEIAEEFAILMLRLAPAGFLDNPMLTPRASDGLSPRMRRLAVNPTRDAGVATTLSALADLIFHERGDPERWSENEAMLSVLQEAQSTMLGGAGPEIEAWIEQSKLRHPLRERQWMQAAKTWRQLRTSVLTTQSIADSARPVVPAPTDG